MILYCFITHKKQLSFTFNRVYQMMTNLGIADYIVVVGGGTATEYIPDKKILHLPANDFYEGLPEKIYEMFQFLARAKRFKKYTHFLKCDDDIIIRKRFPLKKYRKIDYGGILCGPKISRDFHLRRCSPGSYFSQHPYTGPVVMYCNGGMSYIVSRKASVLIAAHQFKPNQEIYEDLFIGKILHAYDITPVKLRLLFFQTIESPEHPIHHPIRFFVEEKTKNLIRFVKNRFTNALWLKSIYLWKIMSFNLTWFKNMFITWEKLI